MASSLDCIFCKIIRGTIPCRKLLETEFSLAFLDVSPLSKGHALVIPKQHGQKLHDIDDKYLQDTLLVAKKVAKAQKLDQYNILQNNGPRAHQEVGHVHFHIIPKPDIQQGLTMQWEPIKVEEKEQDQLLEQIKSELAKSEA